VVVVDADVPVAAGEGWVTVTVTVGLAGVVAAVGELPPHAATPAASSRKAAGATTACSRLITLQKIRRAPGVSLP
jgi:hypothetical protein